MAWYSLLPALALIPVGLIPGFLGHTGSVYTLGTVLLGSYLSYRGAQLAFRHEWCSTSTASGVDHLPSIRVRSDGA